MHRLLLLLFFFISLQAHAQVEWVHQLGYVYKHVVDYEGNVIVVGAFSKEMKIGNILLKTEEAAGAMFIYKTAPNGNVLWAKTFQGFYNYESGLVVDAEGNIFLSGGFHNDFYYDGIKRLSEKDLTWNTFLARLDKQGEVVWIKGLVATETYASIGSSENIFYNVSTGEIVLTGWFKGAVRLDNVTFTSDMANNIGYFFIAVYSKEGNLVWAKTPLDDGFIVPEDIKGDKAGNIYLAGRYGHTVKAGPYTLAATYTKDGGTADIFIAKFQKDGSIGWIKGINKLQPHRLNHSGSAIAINNTTGQLYLAANIKSNVAIDGFVVEKISQQPIGADDWDNTIPSDMLLACFENDGQLVWAKSHGTTGHDYPSYLHLLEDEKGGVFAGAWASQPAFLSFDANGDLSAVKKFSGGGSIEAVSSLPENEYYISGIFNGQLNLGTTVLTAPSYNGFLLKLTACTSAASKPIMPTLSFSCRDVRILNNTGTYSIKWYKDGQIVTNQKEATLNIQTRGNYRASFSNLCGTTFSQEIEVNPADHLPPRPLLTREGCGQIRMLNITDGEVSWYRNDQQLEGQSQAVLHISSSGSYQAGITDACGTSYSELLEIDLEAEKSKLVVFNVITPNADGDNDVLVLPATMPGSAIKVYNRWGKEVYSSLSYQNDWNGSTLPVGIYYYVIMNSCFGRISSPLTILY